MINAKQIADWAATSIAQRDLPRLVRRLVHSTATTTRITMPAGDSISSPGLDGEMYSEVGNAWVPKGHSCWEASCRADVTTKANEDFTKRCTELTLEQKKSRSYVAITGRKWTTKSKWAAAKRGTGEWIDVRAYDADDLEHWLEQSPSVAIAFSEELGLHGAGVSSLERYFESWSKQSEPAISGAALLSGRLRQKELVLKRCQEPKLYKNTGPIPIKGDSVEEVVAFIVAVLADGQDLVDRAAIVTSNDGWVFIEKNNEIAIAIAARPELAETPPVRAGLTLIVPYASGDMAKQFSGLASRLDETDIQLDRADYLEFEKALQDLGVEESDSRRLSVACGRSWSVFRRQHAVNPYVRKPAWLNHPSSHALSTLCLIGTWSTRQVADKCMVARIAGRTYDKVERDLLELERLDDSPVVHIGNVWKAKSALEVLSLFGSRITESEIDRFFAEAASVLEAPNSELELPSDKRYAAAIYGKTRPVSDFLLGALCDTLVKLAVRGPEVPELAAKGIDVRVNRLVRNLLGDADATRWLSLAEQLPSLAEASPSEFLSAIDAGLLRPQSHVKRLLTETDNANSFGGRCWHAGLLWALETLAWSPQRLTRVSKILAKLSHVDIAGNWANTPINTLISIYRSWLPQTSATIDQRIAAIDVLIAYDAEVGVHLVDSLARIGHDVAHPTARPKWRDDDAGAGYGVSGAERQRMLAAAADRQLQMAAHNPDRIANLIRKYDILDPNRRVAVGKLLSDSEVLRDEEKEILRHALRSRIHWHRNYASDQENSDGFLAPLETAYERLAPSDSVVRNAWLFRSSWIEFPYRVRDDDYAERQQIADKARSDALSVVYQTEGWRGIARLAEHAKAGRLVGLAICDAGISAEEAETWVVEATGGVQDNAVLADVAAGFLAIAIQRNGIQSVERVLRIAEECGRNLVWKIRFLTLLPETRAIWNIAEDLGENAYDLYWKECAGRVWSNDTDNDFEYAVRKLVEVGRPSTALDMCSVEIEKLPQDLVMKALEEFLIVKEDSAKVPQWYAITRAIDYLEDYKEVNRTRLAQIEFALVKALGLDAEQKAKSLFHILMSQPEVFVEMICLLYRRQSERQHEEKEENPATQTAASNAWEVLHACTRQPGTDEHGVTTDESLRAFVHKAREMAHECDRLDSCDHTLGEIMAHAPEDQDGVFPFKPVRDALETINSESMFSGFSIGCFNKRGIHSRSLYDGGEQERALASDYRKNAQAVEITHPHLSSALEKLARSYERDGFAEDLEARLRRERP